MLEYVMAGIDGDMRINFYRLVLQNFREYVIMFN